MKIFSDSYLYQASDCNKQIFNYLMTSQRVDKTADSFNDVVYDVKRQAQSILIKVLLNNKVVLMFSEKGISRPFKVIYAKDVKDGDKKKVFIDCTGIISLENGEYKCKKAGVLISYLMAAMTYIIYYNKPDALLTNHVLLKSGTEAFVDLMLYILGYLKVPVTYNDNKERMGFVLAEYFLCCVAGKENGDAVYNLAKQVCGTKDKKICDYYHVLLGQYFSESLTFDKFLSKFAEIFLDQKDDENVKNAPKNRTKLTVDTFAQRWMYAFGPNTYLALELFVPFSQMLSDCYIGAFINQQNTIEKVVGSKNIHTFSNELLKIGSES